MMWQAIKTAGWGLGLAALVSITVQAQINLRGGRHANFNRVVFDFTEIPPYDVRLEDGHLAIRLNMDELVSPSGYEPRALPLLGPVQITQANWGSLIRIAVPEGAALDRFVLDNRLVIDVYPDAVSAQAAAQRREGEATQAVLTADTVLPPAAFAQVSPPKRNTAENFNEAPNTVGGVPDGRTGRAQAVPVYAADGTDAVQGRMTPLLGKVAITASGIDNGVALDLIFETGRPEAAFFLRGGRLWMLFAGRYIYDLEALNFQRPPLDGRVVSAAVLDHPLASGIQMPLSVAQSIVPRRTDKGWRIEIKDTLATPLRPLRIVRQTSGPEPQIFLPVENAWRVITIMDPAVGDRLHIVPVKDAGIGLADSRRFAQFTLLESAQGIVVQPITDNIVVQRFNNGVAVVSSDGLALTGAAADPNLQAGFVQTDEKPERLINLDAWRLGSTEDFIPNRTRLVAAIAALPDTQRNAARWDLARFYVAHDEAAEALGVLELMLQEDETLAQSAAFLAVRGLANLMQQRTGDALSDLRHPDLRVDPDASLWRTTAAEPEGQSAEALDAYDTGRDILGFYKADQQARFRLAAIRAALAEEMFDRADEELEELAKLDLAPAEKGRMTLLRARLAAARGDIVAALDLFEQATQTPDPGASALARLERVRFALAHEGLTPEQAVMELEELRYAWRGRDFEIDLLSILGELYVSIGRYRQGLDTLRQAVDYYPDDPRSSRLVRQMQRYFELFFLEGGQDLSPFDAVALFEDFRELTPQGSMGDRIIRRLVDRLVAVDLLDRAARLLEYQVEFRLEGTAQAQIAARLGKVYLLDRKPEKALEILRATRQQRLPDDVRQDRIHVEARALAELDRFEEALVVLETDTSGAAMELRNDIYWDAQLWDQVADSSEALLGTQPPDRPLDVTERQWVVRRAIALTFLEREDDLRSLRQLWSPAMRDGEFETVFDVFTQLERVVSQSPAQRARSIANVNAFRSFLANYREDFTEGAAANALDPPAPTPTSGSGP